jgi:hypothetical protein
MPAHGRMVAAARYGGEGGTRVRADACRREPSGPGLSQLELAREAQKALALAQHPLGTIYTRRLQDLRDTP